MTITSQSLLIAADAMAKAERARAWLAGNNKPTNPRDFALSLHWNWGRAISGYADVLEAVSQLVAEALPGFIDAAVRSLESQAIAAVRDLSAPEHQPDDGPQTVPCYADDEHPPCFQCTCWKATRAACS